MKEDSPLISIILPVYNGEKFLDQAIQSCLDQTYINFELLIVNDASADRSLEIAKEFEGKDKRIKVLSNTKNLKLPGSLNRGHKAASGSFLTWTSDDNILKPNFLKILLKEITSSNYDLIFTNFDIIWENGDLKRKHKSGPIEDIVFVDTIGASFLYKRKVFEGLGGYNEQLFLVEDYDFFLRAFFRYKIGYLNKNLYQYRINSNSLTSNISLNYKYTYDHRKALKDMFCGLKNDFNITDQTIDLLISLYFNEHISIKDYLTKKDTVKSDIFKIYQSSINSLHNYHDIISCKIFWNWYSNKTDLTLYNLFKIIIYDRSILFNKKNNRNAVIQAIFNCFSPFFNR